MNDSYMALNDTLFVEEVKEGFNDLDIAGVSVKLRDKSGSSYNNFSNKVIVKHTYEGSNHKVGDIIIVHHFVSDQEIEVDGEVFLLCYPEQVIGERFSSNYSLKDKDFMKDFKGVNGHFTSPSGVKQTGEFSTWGNERTNYKTNESTTFNGDVIEYVKNADYEIYHGELLTFYVKEDNVFAVNGEIQDKYYTELTKDVVCDDRFAVKTKDGRRVIGNESVLGLNLIS